jgi:8-oxo-dGTP pyrophosphatase MutT (NUDIX family)
MSEPKRSWIEEVRLRLSSPPALRLPIGEGRQAAVLVPLFVDSGELWTLLTKRADHLPTHKGQYAFPGGGQELGEGPWKAALREAHEEVGIEPRTVLRLGELDEVRSPSGFSIVPCVGAVPFPLAVERNEAEIAEMFSVPLSAFSNPRLVEDRPVVLDGRERMLRIYHLGSRRVWGLTAAILRNLVLRLGLEAPPQDVN